VIGTTPPTTAILLHNADRFMNDLIHASAHPGRPAPSSPIVHRFPSRRCAEPCRSTIETLAATHSSEAPDLSAKVSFTGSQEQGLPRVGLRLNSTKGHTCRSISRYSLTV
jgi:hypothetical protein